jgi:hypothetical protein
MWEAKGNGPCSGSRQGSSSFPKVKSIPRELRRSLSKVVSFKDLHIYDDLHDDVSAAGDDRIPALEPAGSIESTDSTTSTIVRRAGVQKNKLILIMVRMNASIRSLHEC